MGVYITDDAVEFQVRRDYPAEFDAACDEICSRLADELEAVDRKDGIAPHDYSAVRKPLAEGDKQ